MGLSLAFHIIFAAIGIGLFFFMVIAEGMYLRTHRPIYLEVAKRWARGSAIPFAVGAVRCIKMLASQQSTLEVYALKTNIEKHQLI
jgi:cytochrome bd-type quinol oxidase subunit 1